MNILELEVVCLSLMSKIATPGFSIRACSDNTTTVQDINKQGSSKSLQVTLKIKEIVKFCFQKSLTIELHRIPGKLNVLADTLSLNVTLLGEWCFILWIETAT